VELRDFIVTPILVILVYWLAYVIRPHVTDGINRKYFFPALTFKIIGAIALGFLYQFYYDGGDTFNFHTIGSRLIWEAFWESPGKGFDLLLSKGEYLAGTYGYASKIYFYQDQSSFFVIRIATLFDLLTYSTYSGTAVLFALFSFVGSWAFFSAMYRQAPQLHLHTALAILFIPSVLFWGSGLLKDTVTFSCLGLMTYSINNIFISRHQKIGSIFLLIISAWIIFSVKKYILLCFLPAALLWIYADRLAKIRSLILKVLIIPVIAILLVCTGYFSIVLIGMDDPRYALDKIAMTAQITAYDIGFYSGKDAGSGYSLGELDGTFTNMINKAPQAINVSLFRPYLWEIRNPLMFFSAIESFFFLGLTLYAIAKSRSNIFKAMANPVVIFCFVFSLTFAFAVGVSTFNFGTLSRYKIPLLPFYSLGIIYLLNYSNKDKKFAPLETTE
jgi:hypothetical protein